MTNVKTSKQHVENNMFRSVNVPLQVNCKDVHEYTCKINRKDDCKDICKYNCKDNCKDNL